MKIKISDIKQAELAEIDENIVRTNLTRGSGAARRHH